MSAPAVAIHAGAGDRGAALLEEEDRYREALLDALGQARTAIQSGAGAVEAVQAAIVVMEAFELFNAGRGSALCADGSVEMSAALMRSSDGAAGAVAAVRHTEYPIRAAAVVMESPQVLMVGDGVAERSGLAQRPNSYFVTERQRAAGAGRDHGTVGAVCLDADGLLAAGTSTGGIRGQPPGRVGDTPIIGAGTWADRRVAVSCTGDGEAFIRAGVARHIAGMVEHGVPLSEAGDRALGEVSARGGRGGLIAVDAGGGIALPFSTQAMPRGAWRAGEDLSVWVAD